MKYPLLLRKYIYDSKFKDWVDSYGKPNILCFHEYGEENPDMHLYYMKFDKPALGFFAYWKMGIIGLNYAKAYGLHAVIDWTNVSPYYEPDLFGEESNPFDYYFEPISTISVKSVQNSKRVVISDVNRDKIGAFSKGLAYDFDNQIEDYVKINKEYFHIKGDIRNQIDMQIEELFRGKRTLGVHIRGVEWGTIIGHPIPIMLEQYFEWIDFAIKKYGFEQVFIASDSEEAVERCLDRYGKIIVTFEDTLRSRPGSKTLMLFDNSIERESNHFLMGYEVLRDMLALSKSDGLIAGFSNVSLAARVFKESEDCKYVFLNIMESGGVCKKGIGADDAVKKMKQGKFG